MEHIEEDKSRCEDLFEDMRLATPGRGIRPRRLKEASNFIIRYPQKTEYALSILAPHLRYMSPENIIIPWRALCRMRPDLIETFIFNIEDNNNIVEQLKLMAEDSGTMAVWTGCVARIKKLKKEDEVLSIYGDMARKGIRIALNQGGASADKNFLLRAILSIPEATDVRVRVEDNTYEWMEAVVLMAQREVPTLDRLKNVIDLCLESGINLQETGLPSKALGMVSKKYETHQRMREILSVLLDRGAEWEGLGLDKHPKIWRAIQDHPRARMRLLEDFVVKNENGNPQKNRKIRL